MAVGYAAIREQARSHFGVRSPVGASLLAKGPALPTHITEQSCQTASPAKTQRYKPQQ